MKRALGLFLAIIMIMSFVAGCASKGENGSDEGKVVDIKEIYEKIKEVFGEDYTPNREMDLEEIENAIGIKEDDMEEYIAEVPMMSVGVDTFIAIKAKEGRADAIESGLEEYRRYLVEDSMQYPMNIAKVNASKVVRHGDYVFFLMFGKYDDREEAGEEERLDFAKEEVKKAEEIIDGFFK